MILHFFSMGNSKRITSIFLYIKILIFYWCFRRHFYSKTNNKKAYKRKYTTTLFVSIVAMEPAQHHRLHSKLFFALKKIKVTRFFLWSQWVNTGNVFPCLLVYHMF